MSKKYAKKKSKTMDLQEGRGTLFSLMWVFGLSFGIACLVSSIINPELPSWVNVIGTVLSFVGIVGMGKWLEWMLL